MKRITMITTLIPILFLLFVGSVNAEKIYTSDSYFTAGSVILMKIEGETSIKPTGIVYELVDANGHTVYKWKHTPDVMRQVGFLDWYIYDEFEIKLPNMMGFLIFEDRPEGQWKIKTHFEYAKGIIEGSESSFHFNVYKGNIIDNLFAPIYIYKGYKVFGIEIAHMQFKLFPFGWILTIILAIFLFFLSIKYIRFALKQVKIIISRSSARIKKEWRTKG